MEERLGQPEPKTKDWFSLFHEGDTRKRGSKGRGLSILQPKVTLSSNLFLEPNGVLEDSPFN